MNKLRFKSDAEVMLEVPRDRISSVSVWIGDRSVDGELKRAATVTINTNMKLDNLNHFTISFTVTPIEGSRIMSWYTLPEMEGGFDFDYEIGMIEEIREV